MLKPNDPLALKEHSRSSQCKVEGLEYDSLLT